MPAADDLSLYSCARALTVRRSACVLRALISDGELFGSAVVTSECAGWSEAVGLHSLVTLTEYLINTVGSNKVCIIMGMEVVPEDPEKELAKIGEPIKWDSPEAAAAASEAEAARAALVSPKAGVPTHESPKTGVASSRTAPQSFAPQMSQPPSQPGAPLVAARSAPIDSLNPYSNRWQIKARVNTKGDLRTFQSARGDGSLFSMDLSDESGEIRATAWKEVAERLYNQIEVRAVHTSHSRPIAPDPQLCSVLIAPSVCIVFTGWQHVPDRSRPAQGGQQEVLDAQQPLRDHPHLRHADPALRRRAAVEA